MTAKQGWSPATVLGAISIVSGLLTFAVAVFIAMGKDTRTEYQDHDRKITTIEARLESHERQLRRLDDRTERPERPERREAR